MSHSIRPFTVDDVPAALELCRSAGWNQLRTDWARIVEYEPAGCFVAELDGQLAGTVTTTRYGSDVGWIGMMLVDEPFRRRGIASDLIRSSVDYLLGKQVRCIKLDATPTGLQVYKRLGFQTEWTFHRWMREATSDGNRSEDSHQDAAKSACTLAPQHLALDRTAFGADRSNWLQRLAQDSRVSLRRDGFGMIRRGCLADYLGPVVAASRDVAEAIIAELLSPTTAMVFWDVMQPNQAAAETAQSLGFKPVRDLTRMWTGPELLDPAINLQYAICDPGTG